MVGLYVSLLPSYGEDGGPLEKGGIPRSRASYM